MLIGIHGRNDIYYEDIDYQTISIMKAQVIKTMSQTHNSVYDRLIAEHPNIAFIVRLYGSGFGTGHHPTPEQFVMEMLPRIEELKQYTSMFQIHNEPNHIARYEGWGQTDEDAHAFTSWYIEVFNRLKSAHPNLNFGFPGLAVPHRDDRWLEICKSAIEMSDWLGCHCYWQNPNLNENNHLADFWGLRFKMYHDKFPNKDIHILEAGNSNHQNGYPLPEDVMAREMVEWMTTACRFSYVKSASPFILSSPDPNWDGFAWRINGNIRQVAYDVGSIVR